MQITSASECSFEDRRPSACDQGHQIVEDVRRALRDTGYSQIRRLQVIFEHGRITLRGWLPTYYLKQVAQTAALTITAARGIDNEIQVRSCK